MAPKNRYRAIIEGIFASKYRPGADQVEFDRGDIERFAKELAIKLPKNLGDLIYTFRYRAPMPPSIASTASEGETWIIRPAGKGKYRFVSVQEKPLSPNESLASTKVPDSTPGMVAKYALGDEQSLLAKVRYNRLVDIFSGVTCYSLQNHLQTTVREMGQIETDELYVGIDKRGAHYAFPVQAKGGRDRLSAVQIEQDIGMCAEKFPSLICRPIAVQFMADEVIAMFELEETDDGVRIAAEKHYKLVPPEQVSQADLAAYRERLVGR